MYQVYSLIGMLLLISLYIKVKTYRNKIAISIIYLVIVAYIIIFL